MINTFEMVLDLLHKLKRFAIAKEMLVFFFFIHVYQKRTMKEMFNKRFIHLLHQLWSTGWNENETKRGL